MIFREISFRFWKIECFSKIKKEEKKYGQISQKLITFKENSLPCFTLISSALENISL